MGTGIAVKTLLLFCACAILPIVATYLLADRAVTRALEQSARDELSSASKAYGLIVFERLVDAERLLAELAADVQRGHRTTEDIAAFQSQRLHISRVLVEPAGAAERDNAGGNEGARATIAVAMREGRPEVVMHASQANAQRRVMVDAVLDSDYLWNTDVSELAGMRLCVHTEAGLALYCPQQAADAELDLAETWNLFLRPHYGADSWIVTAKAESATALAELASFRSRLPYLMLIAIAIAMLLGAVQIRRSHKPLAMLMAAADNLGRRGSRKRIRIEGSDEYGNLATAFNRMSAGLARQFAVMREQARIDGMILDEPAIGTVVETMLSRLPRLLAAPRVAIAIQAGGATDIDFYRALRIGPAGIERQRASLGTPIQQMLRRHVIHKLNGHSADEQLLRHLMQAEHIAAVPIEAGGVVRGALLVEMRGQRLGAVQARHARAFARRISVALGVEERREALLRRAYYDALTELPNRQLFRDRCNQEISHARREGGKIAIAFVDLDRFKLVNDTLGHIVGDELLQNVARRFQTVLRDGDTLARLGGDEFALLITGPEAEQSHLVAERMLDALRDPLVAGGTSHFLKASIGMAVYPADGLDVDLLLRNADTSMYRAKAAGGGQAIYFEEQMNTELRRRHELEQRLRAALQAGEVGLVYQPQMSLVTGKVCGVEALARWHDPVLGVVSPSVFIPIAEECGLIAALGESALATACKDLQKWRAAGCQLDRVSVNVSLRQLRDRSFVETVLRALSEADVAPSSLEIEVTESVLAHSPRDVAALLQELRALGVRIAIDDFGTGYSSMAVLGQLPLDILKIDRTFIVECAADASAQAVVAAIISMAHALGKQVIAEGIETPEQLAALKRLGCDMVQGYLFAAPMGAAEVPQMLERPGVWPATAAAGGAA